MPLDVVAGGITVGACSLGSGRALDGGAEVGVNALDGVWGAYFKAWLEFKNLVLFGLGVLS